jgi:hypothetical protein
MAAIGRDTRSSEVLATSHLPPMTPLRIMESRLTKYLARDPVMPDDFDMTIQANPSKEFFVEMLTKDISLSECILDLVDNSVHSLIRYNNLDVVSDLFGGRLPKKNVAATIDIKFSSSKFSITDSCGGITIEEAAEHVFLFGKPLADPTHTGLGVYGIGMKRAMFKIGRKIIVRSTTKDESFKVDFDVAAWLAKPKIWNLEFAEVSRRKNKAQGTAVEITVLHETAKKYFSSATFQKTLRERIATTYSLFIKAGLTIELNGKAIDADMPEFAESKDLKPARRMTKYDGVEVLLMAGMTPRDDRQPRGWYIYCNGRLVLDADKTSRTGWGVDHVPDFHPKFNHFLGMAFFRSKDVRALPWTTTKEGVELEAPVYQFALAEMRTMSRPALAFLSRMYPDVRVESEGERDVLQNAKGTGVQKIAGRGNAPLKADVPRKKENDLVHIQYKRSRKDVEKIKRAIGKPKLSAVGVGEYTFDVFLRRNT